MAITVQTPSGTVEFPDGTPDATIEAALQSAHPAPAAPASAPGVAPAGGMAATAAPAAAPGAPVAPPVPGAAPPQYYQPGAVRPEGAAADESGQRLPVAPGETGFKVEADWSKLNPAQKTAYQDFQASGNFSPAAPLGSEENPYVVDTPEAAKQLPVGSAYFDGEGQLQTNKGRVGALGEALGLYEASQKPINNVANWAMNGLEALGVDKGKLQAFDEGANSLLGLPGTREKKARDEALLQAAAQKGVRPGLLGSTAGTLIGSAPFTPGVTNPLLAGAIIGAVNSDRKDVKGVAFDAGAGAAFGKAGDLGVKFVGSTISPHVRPAVQRLLDKGVLLTPGEIRGGGLQKVEDAIRSFPFLGDLIVASQKRGLDSANVAAVNDALAPIGSRVPGNIRAGHDAVDHAQRQLSDAYNTLLPRTTMRADPTMIQNLRNLRGAVVQGLPRQQAQDFDNLLQNEVVRRFGANGTMSGETFKEVEEVLGREIKQFSGNNAGPHERKYADAVRELQDQLRSTLGRSNPAAAQRLADINAGYAVLTRIEQAAAGSPRGVFTGKALKAATRTMDTTARKRASARGDALLQPHAEDMLEVMTPSIPDSGTATRGLVNAGATAALVGGSQLAHMSVNPMAAAGFAGLLAPYTRTGGRIARTVLARRPAGAAALRQGVDALAPTGGRVAASVAASERAKKAEMAAPNDAVGGE